MTIVQILAIISLLLAFGVDQPTATKVKGILRASVPQEQVVPPPVGGVAAPLPTVPSTTVPTMPEPEVKKELSLSVSSEGVAVEGEQSVVITVSYLVDGKSQRDVNVLMKTPDQSQDASAPIIAQNGKTKVWYRGFAYKPKSEGNHELTFCVGDVCRSVTIKGI